MLVLCHKWQIIAMINAKVSIDIYNNTSISEIHWIAGTNREVHAALNNAGRVRKQYIFIRVEWSDHKLPGRSGKVGQVNAQKFHNLVRPQFASASLSGTKNRPDK
jgi:hypothetical protein